MFATTKQTYSELWSNCRKEKEKKSTLWKVARYCFGSLQVIKSSKKQSQGLFWLDANIGAISSKLHVTNTRFKNAPPNPVFKSDVIIRFWFQTLLLVPKSNEHGSIIESYKLSKFFIIKKNNQCGRSIRFTIKLKIQVSSKTEFIMFNGVRR